MITIIKTEKQYEEALDRVEQLMDAGASPGTDDGDTLEVLVFLINAYERKNHPVVLPDPVDAVKFRMDQQGLKPKDLEPFLGSKSRVSEVLNRKRPLTLRMIRELHKGLGIPAEVLINEPGAKTIPLSENPIYAAGKVASPKPGSGAKKS
jgi:HTH-type transcriptional regulator / antitoxin HigA